MPIIRFGDKSTQKKSELP